MAPDTDYEATAYQLAFLEFAWDIERALEFALFRTYAVPAISGLLARTGKFTTQPRKRYDDTELLLSEPLEHGLSSERGQQAIDRINAIHGRFKIANEDMLYVLSTFVLEPIRWMDRFGRRAFTPDEIRAWTDYYRAVGHKMGISEIPTEFQAFEAMNLSYEAEHFRYAESNRQIGDTTLDLLLGFYLPRSLVSLGRPVALSFMDPALLSSMGYAAPSPFVRQLVDSAMRIRSAVLRVMPRRKRPRLMSCHMSGRRLIWPNSSPRKVGHAVRAKTSRISPKTEFFNTIGGFRPSAATAQSRCPREASGHSPSV